MSYPEIAPTPEPLNENAQIALAKIHAVELAKARHTIGTARYAGTDDKGVALWYVPSRSQRHQVYFVKHAYRSAMPVCDCPSVKPCSHIGAVLHAEQQRDEALAQAQREHDDWWRYANMGGALLDCMRGW